MKRLIALCSGLVAGLVATLAPGQAKEFSDRGTLAFGADRMFGVYITHRELEGPDPLEERESDGTEVGLLWQGPAGLTAYTVPRIGVDYFVIDRLSLGGSLGYFSANIDDDGAGGADMSGFVFGPRVGFGTMFNSWAGIWPRGGFSYYSYHWADSLEADQLALTAECMFVLQPAEGFAFLVGPTIDFGLTGEAEVDARGARGDADLGANAFGIIVAGLMGWL